MQAPDSALLGNIDFNKRVHIVGGGFSGLILAYHLKKNNIPFTLFEKEVSTGGKITTLSGEYGDAEAGAHAFFANEEMISSFEALGLKVLRSQKNLKKKIYRNHSLNAPPLRFYEIVRIVFNLCTKKLPPITNKTTVHDLIVPLAGESIAEDVLCAIYHGVYAADTNVLNLKSLFNRVDFEKIKTYRDFFSQYRRLKVEGPYSSVSFEGGMGALISKLTTYLQEDIQLRSPIQSIEENSILCTNSHEAADLLQTNIPEIAKQLRRISYLPVTACTVHTSTKIPQLDQSFGCLFPTRNRDRKILGVLNNYEIFPQQRIKPEIHSYTFILATARSAEHELQQELKTLGWDALWTNKKQILYKSWPQGFPLYDKERFSAMNQLKKMDFRNYALFGNYIDGISLREIYLKAKRISNEAKNEASK